MKRKTLGTVSAGIIWVLGTAQACGGDDPAGASSPNMGGDSGDGDGDGDGDGAGASAATGGSGSGGTTPTSSGGTGEPSPCELDGVELQPLPYDVSDDFYYVNEIPEDTGSALVVVGATCDDVPDGGLGGGVGVGGAGGAAGTDGSCYVFDYTPDNDGDSETPLTWGGIIVQSNEMPDGKGDTGAGICIEPGATMISFEAKADNDITDVKFGAIRPGPGSTEHWVRLTSTWAEYTVSIPVGETYNDYSDTGGVWNGFSAVLEWNNQDGDPLPDVTRISIRNVVWQK